ncbi:unnamed protein product [Camellia sinensis]
MQSSEGAIEAPTEFLTEKPSTKRPTLTNCRAEATMSQPHYFTNSAADPKVEESYLAETGCLEMGVKITQRSVLLRKYQG